MEDLNQDWEATTAEAVKEAEESDLFPTATYEGLVESFTSRVVDKPESPLHGVRVARVRASIFDVPPRGRTRPYFFDVTPVLVRNEEGELRSESKHAATLAKLTGTVGQPFGETLEAAKETRLRFRIRKAEAKGQYDARNWLDAISAIR